MDNELNQDFFDLTKNQQEACLTNYTRKLEYINESKLNLEQKKEIMFGKNEITTQLEKI